MPAYKFTIYQVLGGTITRSGESNVPAEMQPLEPGEALLAGVSGNPLTERVDVTQDPPAVAPIPEFG